MEKEKENTNMNDTHVRNKNKDDHMMVCDVCGSKYYRSGNLRHMRSKKHKDAQYVWLERFEIIR